MKFVRNLFATAALVSATVFAVGASAQTVYTDQAAFSAATSGVASYTFPQGSGFSAVGNPYTLNGVTFNSTNAYEGNDGGYGATAYLDSNTNLLGVSTARSALGLLLSSYDGAETVTYNFAGTVGSINLGSMRAISFLGFTSAGGEPINVQFTTPSELDTTGFQVGVAGAVPEPASWAMMILGMGAVGFAIRSAKRRSEDKFDAKIKKITYGAVA